MNQQTRLILVEGVPFTGKSTTSEYVTTQLNLNGYPAHWMSEGMMLQHFPHALAVIERQQSLSEAVLRAEWSAFVETMLATATIFVVDSALSYAAVGPLLDEDRSEEAIYTELRRIADLCGPLQPRVIHLMGDVEYLVPASITERGEGWREQLIRLAETAPYQQARGRSGVAGATSLMHASQEMMRAILAQDAWQTLTLDVPPADWSAHRRTILDFLHLNEITVERPVVARSVLQSYVGTYLTDDPDRRDKMLSVQLDQDTLTLHGANQHYGPLVPVSMTRFHLQASPVDIEFMVEDELVPSLTILTSDSKTHSYRRA